MIYKSGAEVCDSYSARASKIDKKSPPLILLHLSEDLTRNKDLLFSLLQPEGGGRGRVNLGEAVMFICPEDDVVAAAAVETQGRCYGELALPFFTSQ